jgi:hypothetical protein
MSRRNPCLEAIIKELNERGIPYEVIRFKKHWGIPLGRYCASTTHDDGAERSGRVECVDQHPGAGPAAA